MTNCVLLVGPLCSGKTMLAEKLAEKAFIKNESNFYSIEQNRKDFGDGQMSGEMFAWANFLQQMEYPPTNDNAIYEFSGTGRNVFNVSGAIEYAKGQAECNWVVVYCLAATDVLMARYPNKTYDAPIPYNLGGNVESSINYMNGELKDTYGNARQWNSSTKLKFNMNVEDYGPIADEIINHFNQ
jgi:hypothetical protein